MYIAHIKEENQCFQSVAEHSWNTGKLAEAICNIPELKTIAFIAGFLHDAGKNTAEFKDYILKSKEKDSDVKRGEIVHSTAGAIIVSELAKELINEKPEFTNELLREAIISHHGIYDCVTPEGIISYEKRLEKMVSVESIKNEVFSSLSKEKLLEMYKRSIQEVDALIDRIISFVGKTANKYGSRHFYFGITARMLMSLLIDADRTDTACFMSGKPLPEKLSEDAVQNMWRSFLNILENNLDKFGKSSAIDSQRSEISNSCLCAAEKPVGIYRLVVPTGAGKTLSSLRYALRHAEIYKKKHIFYIAPYNSILEQNASVIRKYLNADNEVLEHHCNIVLDEEGEYARYKELTAAWDSPIIVTTAVQFFNSLFLHKTSSVRRMHTLADSVIIIDEIQSIPIKCLSLFNLAINYLSNICKSTVILCSATQPLLDKLDNNCLARPEDIIPDYRKYKSAFKRTEIYDCTDIKPGGFSINDTVDFVLNKINDSQNILVVVNTKSCARKLFMSLREVISELKEADEIELYHLSTNMCAAHRKDVLESIRKNLISKNKKMICISTQLIEAGVDISFEIVIRSIAGLDNIIQAAGRCNRNFEFKMGKVYIVWISEEDLSRLYDIKMAQNAMFTVLNTYHTKPELVDGDLFSEKAMDLYYTHYFVSRKSEMDYKIHELDTTVVELLSENRAGVNNYLRKNQGKRLNVILRQAFKTAGEYFNVITDNGQTDIVVEYDDESIKLIGEANSEISKACLMQILRKLQLYSVSIPDSLKHALISQNGLVPLKNAGILALRKEFYSKETGVTENPSIMDTYFY